MNQTVHVLLVEDSDKDAALIIRELRKAGLQTYRATGRGYFGQQQVVDLLSYLRLLHNRYDDEAVVSVLAGIDAAVGVEHLDLANLAQIDRPLPPLRYRVTGDIGCLGGALLVVEVEFGWHLPEERLVAAGGRRVPGSAAHAAEKRLRHHKFSIARRAENFWVEGTPGPLSDGELDRARRWGEDLASELLHAKGTERAS